MNTRTIRIARGIQAILDPSEFPEPSEADSHEFKGRGSTIRYDFTTSDGVNYGVDFEKEDTQQAWNRNDYEVAFGVYNPNTGELEASTVYKSENTMEVMQAVAAKIRDFVEDYLPNFLIYHPTSDSRSNLYKHMIKRLLPDAKLTLDYGTYIIDLRDEEDRSIEYDEYEEE